MKPLEIDSYDHILSYLKHVFFTDEHHMSFVQHEGE